MYEVYNDRIFDLLTGSATSGKNPQKRRALLYKSTEHRPDRKVVAGLKKVICADLEEALLVLETGLMERRVAGTGSNATSSRSHGFFCVEVKKRYRRRGMPGPWASSSMTIVDLAGTERARTAKTAGATLAEAGKINESLMFLGQCMQMQSDNAHTPNPKQVPYRQCKLTEILFSNSCVPSEHSQKARQKAIMIVTADPLSDYNATSQILRYSALAREVTVSRIPTTGSAVLAGAGMARCSDLTSRPTSPSAVMEELAAALTEATRLREELEVTRFHLEEEMQRRTQAEASWAAAELRIADVEAEIREEVCADMDAQMARAHRRWKAARDEEFDRQDEHLDRKLEIIAQSTATYVDEEAEKENVNILCPEVSKISVSTARAQRLEDENERLKQKIAIMEREKGLRSPSKKMRVLKTRKWEGSGMGLDS